LVKVRYVTERSTRVPCEMVPVEEPYFVMLKFDPFERKEFLEPIEDEL
jgi:hypothetical protein